MVFGFLKKQKERIKAAGPAIEKPAWIAKNEGAQIKQKEKPEWIDKNESVQITAKELKSKLDKNEGIVLIDVRELWENQLCSIQPSILIPLGQLESRSGELDKSKETILYCHSGNRSMVALRKLQGLGFEKVKNLEGGIGAWAEEIEPGMERY